MRYPALGRLPVIPLVVAVLSMAAAGSPAAASVDRPPQVRSFLIPSRGSQPIKIMLGPDGNMWFTEQNAHQVARITPNGEIKIWAQGAQQFNYLEGRWRLTEVAERYRQWSRAVSDARLAELLFNLALNLAEARRGGDNARIRAPARACLGSGARGRAAASSMAGRARASLRRASSRPCRDGRRPRSSIPARDR